MRSMQIFRSLARSAMTISTNVASSHHHATTRLMLMNSNVRAHRSISRALSLLQAFSTRWRPSIRLQQVNIRPWHSTSIHAAKRVSKKTIITQGSIDGPSLPPVEKTDRQETLMQLVRRITSEYPECVVLTRVGKFYEASCTTRWRTRLTKIALLRTC